MAANNITIKASLDNDLRRISVERTISLEELVTTLQARFTTDDDITLKWVDEDGDHVTLDSSADLAEAMSDTDKIRLILSTKKTAAEPAPEAPRTDSTTTGTPEQPEIKEGFQNFASQLKTQFGVEVPEEAIEHLSAGLSKVVPVIQDIARNATEELQRAAQEAEKAQHEAQQGKCPFPEMKEQMKEAAEKLREQMQEMKQAADKAQSNATAGATHPCFAHFQKAAQEAAAQMKEAAEQNKKDMLGCGMPAFMPHGIFQHFQQVAEKVTEAAKEAKDKAEREAAGQGVHWGVYCDQSGTHPIVGPRWHKCGENFDLCNAEFIKLSEEERSLFERIERPGDQVPTPYTADGDAEFPAAPADDALVGEPAQQNATEIASPAVSIGDAMSQLGLGEDAMSASILLDLQGALNDNAAQAEAHAIEESAAELVAAAEAEAKAAAEATEAEAKAAAEAAEAKAAAEAAEAKAAAEAAEAKAAAEAAKATEAKAAAEAAEAKAAAEAAEAKAAAEAAEAKAADVMVHPLIEQIVSMGFDAEQAAVVLDATDGDLEHAITMLLSMPTPEPTPEVPAPADGGWTEVGDRASPETNRKGQPKGNHSEDSNDSDSSDDSVEGWDDLLTELVEMGFEDEAINREVLVQSKGDVKDAVKTLVLRERELRSGKAAA